MKKKKKKDRTYFKIQNFFFFFLLEISRKKKTPRAFQNNPILIHIKFFEKKNCFWPFFKKRFLAKETFTRPSFQISKLSQGKYDEYSTLWRFQQSLKRQNSFSITLQRLECRLHINQGTVNIFVDEITVVII